MYAQVFTSQGFTHIYPIERKSQAGEAYKDFIDDVGVPEYITLNNAPEQVGPQSDFQKYCRRYHTSVHQIEPYSPWQNRAEHEIGKL